MHCPGPGFGRFSQLEHSLVFHLYLSLALVNSWFQSFSMPFSLSFVPWKSILFLVSPSLSIPADHPLPQVVGIILAEQCTRRNVQDCRTGREFSAVVGPAIETG